MVCVCVCDCVCVCVFVPKNKNGIIVPERELREIFVLKAERVAGG